MSIDRTRYEGLAGFRGALRRFLAASEAISAEGGVTSQQYQAMLAIGAAPPQPMKALAEQLLLQSNAAVQMVDRLQKLGLAERRPSPTDGRVVLVQLTARGERLLDDLSSRHLEEILDQEPRLSAALQHLKAKAQAGA